MTDRKVAWIVVLVALAVLLAAGCFILLAVPELLADQPGIENCLALDRLTDCRACCEDLGGSHVACTHACAKKLDVSPSGIEP